MKFSASIQHSKNTFYRLANVQYSTFCIGQILVWMVCAGVCLFVAISNSQNVVLFCIFMFSACWLVTAIKMPANRKAEKLANLCKEKFPRTEYFFEEDGITVKSVEDSISLEYKRVFAFLEDAEYYYLFLNRYSGYMVSKDSISPAECKVFREFLEKKTGRHCMRPTSIFNLNIRRLCMLFK